MDKEARNEFDELMEGALASYGEVPARVGLEERVLRRVGEPGPRRWLAAWVLCAVAAALCVLLWWPKGVRERVNVETEGYAIRAAPLPERQLTLVSLERPKRRKRVVRAEPKLAMFPTIAPLSGEERALARLVAEHPDRIPPELLEQNVPIKPIEITAVEIKPLQ